jgi:zona occludens toxin (predicted ATPase)
MYTGTPGSGKSLHSARDILRALKRGSLVVANFDINLSGVKVHPKSRFVYLQNKQLLPSPVRLVKEIMDYQQEFGKRKVVCVLDECQLLFDSRGWNSPNRPAWNTFFSEHRKVGGDNIEIILVTQDSGMVDKRIRKCVEYDISHRKTANFGLMGFWISLFFGGNLFSYQVVANSFGKKRTEAHFFRGRKQEFSLYDTLLIFE